MVSDRFCLQNLTRVEEYDESEKVALNEKDQILEKCLCL